MQTFIIKKGDTVKIIAGKDRGKTGKVLKTYPVQARVLVEGINLYTKHVKPKSTNEKGQKVIVPRPLQISNAQVVCPSCGKASRIGMRVTQGKKERVCKRCGAQI